MLLVSLIVTILTLGGAYLIRVCTKNGDHFKGRGVKFMKPKFLHGNTQELTTQKVNVFDFIRGMYNSYPEEKAFGLFAMRKPILLLRDPTIIKDLLVKEFDKFMDHDAVIREDMDSLVGNVLLSLNGQKWKDMRATLSPIFTGSKMRQMFELVVELFEKMVKDLPDSELEMKEFCGRVTSDVIATCAFGLETNAIQDPTNEFYKLGQKVMDNSARMLKIVGFMVFPKLMKALNVQVVEAKLKDFFRKIIRDTIKHREEKNVQRTDMINLIMEVKRQAQEDSSKPQWTEEELMAQCLIFFLAGFDTSSTATSFAMYNVATNPRVQEKLYEEIKSVQEELNGKPLTFEALQGMEYLDAVVNEVLRITPPAAFTDRLCTEDFAYEKEDFSYNFKKGESVWIPIHGLHMSEKYFSHPEQFVPERFTKEYRHEINPDAFIPFGVGQRSCIANRFALMEVKAFLFYMVGHFCLKATEKTQIPIKIIPAMGPITTEKGIWVGMSRR